MSTKLIDRNPSLLRLIDEGYDVEIVHQHLLVHSIPYLNSEGTVELGVLACSYAGMGDQDSVPKDHTMWFQANKPFMSSGQEMTHVVNHSRPMQLFQGFTAQHFLSNKANGQAFTNFYDKVVHYHTLFVSEARTVDPNADARTGRVHRERDCKSVFQYPDTASSRVGITALSQKFQGDKIAIVGLGGTGSYILDQLAKTPVSSILLCDGDILEPHNAFRSPGAIAFEVLEKKPKKVEYYQGLYSQMHKNIEIVDEFITTENVSILKDCDFVFLSVDSGSARKLLTDYLVEVGIAFIDVGLGIERLELEGGDAVLRGSCRVTLATPEKHDHLSKYLVFTDDDPDEALYKSNIQVADMNGMNAMLAVGLWKQYKSFYQGECNNPHNMVYTQTFQSISRSEEQCE
ncbi:TPA: ThiF family adenylyltransferase [Vibrio parahaemolyticus]|uniref:ThiF family adenylyltransferase n=1 Tax=Vibrio TaxID=662 RepID=UPI0003F74B7B|nr:ThiF family adenylyltransferase [Vibrio parahaemolyticus]EGQ7949776.1 ThiF family adenylyltransferase [Vibrio vulnificus]EGQ8029630.1 ThiF family adenylyltransferase [Vibrio parahaemolyticus]EGQ9518528.1 ThiF family adenylyltransferase [Vibrio parahaemolyticus]EGR2843577.1 ThiF family adenylyltransferase [Vibrio parahaemolyticus]EGR3041448.1 ThiF family adenylyltransferase [Vibrio parahaemolyticus]